MPRASVVSRDDAIAMVETFMIHFTKKPYPRYTSVVWKDMSDFLEGRWTPHNFYVNVRNNRRSIVSTACSNKGIPFDDAPVDDDRNNTTPDYSMNDSYNFEAESADLDGFKVHVTNDEWKAMQEPTIKYGNRKYPILKRGVWTDMLSLAIFKQTQLSCAFIFENSKVYSRLGQKN